QLAAAALDASAKIYSARVDSIHADTYKVLSSLGRHHDPPKEPDSSQEGGNSLFFF
ncbi:CND2 protein, partial [Chaetops frenatus]|nr:CND2 protein [Chaetops frenatus]